MDVNPKEVRFNLMALANVPVAEEEEEAAEAKSTEAKSTEAAAEEGEAKEQPAESE